MFRGTFRAIFGNFWLKLLALIISVGMWFYANNSLIDQKDFDARVTVIPPDGHKIVLQKQQDVRVRVSGPRSVLDRVENDIIHNLTRTLTVQELKDGWAKLPVDRDWLRFTLPESDIVQLRFKYVTPPEVDVFVSPIRMAVVLPVKIQTSGMPAAGFRLVPEPEATPSEVTVRGPAVAVDGMKFVPTASIPVYGSRSDIYQPIALTEDVEVALDSGDRVTVHLALSQTAVDARVYVSGEQEQEQRFDNVPIALTVLPGFPYGVELLEGEVNVSVVVTASPANLKKLKPESIKADVDLTTLADEQIEVGGSAPYKERVRVWLPPDVTYRAVRCEPERVTLLLKNPAE